MDRLLMEAGLITEKTLNSHITLVDEFQSLPVESSETEEDLEEIPSRLKGSKVQESDSVQSIKNNKIIRNHSNFVRYNLGTQESKGDEKIDIESLEFGSKSDSSKKSSNNLVTLTSAIDTFKQSFVRSTSSQSKNYQQRQFSLNSQSNKSIPK